MVDDKWYRVNNPSVIQEVLDGEAVIVNLTTGSYYSTDQSGATIWSVLARGGTVADIVTHLRIHHTGVPDNVDAVVRQWLDVLESESLVVGEVLGEGTTRNPTSVATEEGKRTSFIEPKIEKYTDMEDLLLLDPIHEVQETGWPRASEKAAD